MNFLWIHHPFTMTVEPQKHRSGHFGVYCSNMGDHVIILTYYSIDFFITGVLLYMFAIRLISVHKIVGPILKLKKERSHTDMYHTNKNILKLKRYNSKSKSKSKSDAIMTPQTPDQGFFGDHLAGEPTAATVTGSGDGSDITIHLPVDSGTDKKEIETRVITMGRMRSDTEDTGTGTPVLARRMSPCVEIIEVNDQTSPKPDYNSDANISSDEDGKTPSAYGMNDKIVDSDSEGDLGSDKLSHSPSLSSATKKRHAEELQLRKSKSLLNIARNSTIYTAISVISTWVIFMSAIVEDPPVPEIRYLFVMDWAVKFIQIALCVNIYDSTDQCMVFILNVSFCSFGSK